MIGNHANHGIPLKGDQQLALRRGIFLGGILQFFVDILEGEVAIELPHIFRNQPPHLRDIILSVQNFHKAHPSDGFFRLS